MPKPEPMSAEDMISKIWNSIELMGYTRFTMLIHEQYALIRQAAREAGRREASQWISVKDRLPEIAHTVICAIDADPPWVDFLFYTPTGWSEALKVSHWMPLPDTPASPCADRYTELHVSAHASNPGATVGKPSPCTTCRDDAVCGEDFTPCEGKP